MGIPDFLSSIPDNNAKDSGFHKPKFPEFRKLDSLTWGETFQWAGGGGAGEGGHKGVAFYWAARGLFLPLSPSCIIYVQSSVLPVYNPFPRWSLTRAV